jgi:hypothetical protein
MVEPTDRRDQNQPAERGDVWRDALRQGAGSPSAIPRTAIPRGRQGGSTSSITIAARRERVTSRSFFGTRAQPA